MKRPDIRNDVDYYPWRKEFCTHKNENKRNNCTDHIYDCTCDDKGIYMNCEEKGLIPPPIRVDTTVKFSNLRGNQISKKWENTSFLNYHNVLYLNLEENRIKNLRPKLIHNVYVLEISFNLIKKLESKSFGPNLRHLIFRDNHILDLAENVFEDTPHLQHIDCKGNRIRNLGNRIFSNLTTLRYLSLKNNKIDSFSSIITRNSKELLVLDLSGNFISKIQNETFLTTKKLKYINLNNNKLTALQWVVFDNLTNIHELNLTHNQIANVKYDHSNGNITIYKLDMSSNNLTTLQRSSFTCQKVIQITELNVRNNQIDTMGNGTFEEMLNITILELSSNKLKTLEWNIFQNLPSLEELHLDNNKIASIINDGTMVMPQLRIINLYRNNLTNLQRSSFEFQKTAEFTSIYLQENQIYNIEEGAFRINQDYIKIYLKHNKLHNLRSNTFLVDRATELNTFCEVTNDEELPPQQRCLKVMLNLSYNKITNLDSDFINTTKSGPIFIEEPCFSLSNNWLVEIQENTFSGKSFNILKLNNMKLETLNSLSFQNIGNVFRLDLNDNEITSIGNSTFSHIGFNITRELNLRKNKLNELKSKTFSGMTILRKLNLASNKISITENNSFSGLGKLHYLSLDNNKLTKLDADTFAGLKLLLVLHLEHNQIITIKNQCFSRMSHLQYLSLSSNSLFKINDQTFLGLRSLLYLHLKHNYIRQITRNTFQDNPDLHVLDVDRFDICCLAKQAECTTFPDEFSTCTDLLADTSLKIWIWIMGGTAIISNIFVIVLRSRTSTNEISKIHLFLIQNLALSDLLMGVYLIIIAIADFCYRGEYFFHAYKWRTSYECYFAGFLATFSSELTVFTLTVFVIIAMRYLLMYIIVNKEQSTIARNPSERQTMAFHMTLLISANAACWLPIIVLGILSLNGYSMNPSVYAWVAVFIIPLNAGLNPILYTSPYMLRTKIINSLRNSLHRSNHTRTVTEGSKR